MNTIAFPLTLIFFVASVIIGGAFRKSADGKIYTLLNRLTYLPVIVVGGGLMVFIVWNFIRGRLTLTLLVPFFVLFVVVLAITAFKNNKATR
ncbi:MAG: hypothetical protein ABF743_12590 [Schleiferilactobacillus perolens]|uniref:hypothetical protein n=1 Tax=Schleiferilactobacillus perolens TaxID=100468 RepID=UPI0039EA4234